MLLVLLLRSERVNWLLLELKDGKPKIPLGGAVPIHWNPGFGSVSETKFPVAALPVNCQAMDWALGLRPT